MLAASPALAPPARPRPLGTRGHSPGLAAAATLLVAALPVAAALVGCPPRAGGPPLERLPLLTTDDPRAEDALRRAREALDAERWPEALRLYERFLADYPRDALVPLAHLGRGRARLALEDVRGAREDFARLVEHRDPGLSERGRFYDGIALARAGEPAAALERLRPFAGRTIDPQETALLLEALAVAANATGDALAALDALDDWLRSAVPAASRARAETLLRATVAALGVDMLDRAIRLLPKDGAPWALAVRRAARLAYERGELDRVHELVEALTDAGIALDEELQAMALRAGRAHSADPYAIGAILPLTGRGREVAESALSGLLLAANAPAQGPPGPGSLQVVFRDDASDPERAVRAVEDLASLHRVIAIVGPLEGASAERAGARAATLGVPLLALTPAPNVPAAGETVFRLFVTGDGEARVLVDAARTRGRRRLAILYPATAYGEAMRSAFERAAAAATLEVVAAESYEQGAASWTRVAESVAARGPDAVVLADGGRAVALLAPALAAAGLWCAADAAPAVRGARVTTCLVPSAGFDPSLPRLAGRYLQGALFSVPFHAPTAEGASREFVTRYEARFGRAPDLYAAYAYDAVRLVAAAVASGALTRPQVRAWLAEGRLATAAAGGGFSDAREPLEPTRLVELRGQLFLPPAQASQR